MLPHDLRRPFKRAAISDQQRHRELSLQRQAQHRRNAEHQAPCLASLLNLHFDPNPNPKPHPNPISLFLSDQTYYVIDMVCWREYSLYDCAAEFRFFWLSSKLAEIGACDPPSQYHRYRISPVPVYNFYLQLILVQSLV